MMRLLLLLSFFLLLLTWNIFFLKSGTNFGYQTMKKKKFIFYSQSK